MSLLRIVIQNPKNLEMKIDQYLSPTTHLIYLTGATLNCSLILNGDGECRTDWSPQSGLATYWAKGSTNYATIVTGNGFTDYAQRIEFGDEPYAVLIAYDKVGNYEILSDTTYYISFKYRSSDTLYVYSNWDSEEITNLPSNTGDASFYETTFSTTMTGNLTFVVLDGWLEIDEVNLYIS